MRHQAQHVLPRMEVSMISMVDSEMNTLMVSSMPNGISKAQGRRATLYVTASAMSAAMVMVTVM